MANKLIKTNNLIHLIKKGGIKRIDKKAVELFAKKIESETIKKIKILKEEVITSGRKTLKKEDIKYAFEKNIIAPEI